MISLEANINLPASKSISNRVLMIQALCKEKFKTDNLSEANDTFLLQHILSSIQETNEIQEINVEDAGTPFRFLTAYLSTLEGKSFLLTGTKRMNERPIASLVEGLNVLGADISYTEKKGFPPLLIKGKKLHGNEINIDSSESSQFVSALCLIAPTFDNGLKINLSENIVSASYINMTLSVMNDFGIEYQKVNNSILIASKKYQSKNYFIENDWSSACFFYAMAMIVDETKITLKGLKSTSSQGDSFIAVLCKSFGIETTFENNYCIVSKKLNNTNNLQLTTCNLNNFPDLAIPFIVACAIKYPTIKISGLTHLAFKESNRLEALKTELQKVHIYLHYENDILSFENKMNDYTSKEICFNSYNDHRIVMALNLFSIIGFTVSFDDKTCVKKSFPNYWNEVENINLFYK